MKAATSLWVAWAVLIGTIGADSARASCWLFYGAKSNRTQKLFGVFADRGVLQQKVVCCDACQQRLISRQGPLAFVKKVLAH